MAGDWIKMATTLDTNPHVLEMVDLLEREVLHVIGMLWKVWSWADAHSLDGNALRVTDVTLDRFTNCPGFADALRKVGWLEGRDRALSFPRFAEHNGQTAKNRALCKDRVTKNRNALRVTDVTQEPLPEKRREEKRKKEEKETAAGAATFSDFDAWWSLYPKKSGKDAARRAYQNAVKKLRAAGAANGEAHGRLLEALRRYAASPKAASRYCWNPATWLNQGHWEDDPAVWDRGDDEPVRKESPPERNLPYFDEMKS